MQNRNWFAGVSMLLALLGCGEDENGGGAGTPAICQRVCERAAAARCRNPEPNCQSLCVAARNSTPMECDAQLDAFTHCALRATFTCDAMGDSEAANCTALSDAWIQCYQGGAPVADAGLPARDAGSSPSPITNDAAVQTPVDAGSRPVDAGAPAVDAGTSQPTADAGPVKPTSDAGMQPGPGLVSCEPLATDESCDICLKTSCCSVLSACGADCVALGTCIADCETQACADTCYAAHPQGLAQFNAITACGETSCLNACSDDE